MLWSIHRRQSAGVLGTAAFKPANNPTIAPKRQDRARIDSLQIGKPRQSVTGQLQQFNSLPCKCLLRVDKRDKPLNRRYAWLLPDSGTEMIVFFRAANFGCQPGAVAQEPSKLGQHSVLCLGYAVLDSPELHDASG